MQKKLLTFIFRQAETRGNLILIAALLATVTMLFFIPGLKISSSYQELISPEHPEQKKYAQYKDEFGASDNVIIVLEGKRENLKEAAEYFASELRSDREWIKSLFYKSDSELVINNLPLYIPDDKLKKAESILKKNTRYIGMLARVNNLGSMVNMTLPLMGSAGGKLDEDSVLEGLKIVNAFLADWVAFINDPGEKEFAAFDHVPGKDAKEFISLVKSEGYLFSRDYSMLFIFAQPSTSRDDIDYLRPLMKHIRMLEGRVRKQHDELMKDIKISYTGMPMHVLTETETIYSDVGRIGIISVILVAFILLFGFRSLKKMLIGVAPLLTGIVITLGVFSLTIGVLNIISSSFLAVLFGIGIDFSIYFIRRTEEELGNGLSNREAVKAAVEITGKGILTGGLTTGLAFFAIMLSDFAGYTQLGFTAGLGIFIVLLSTFFIMPSLLLRFPISPRVYQINEHSRLVTLSSSKPGVVFMSLFLLVSVGLGLYAATQMKMDYNVLKLLPRKTESTITQFKMEEKSDFSMSTATVTDSSLEGITAKVNRLRKLPTVNRVDSVSDLIPVNQNRKLGIINNLKPLFAQLNIRYIPQKFTRESLAAILDRLLEAMEMGQEKAFAGGMTKLEGGLNNSIKKIEAIQDILDKNPEKAIAGTERFERELFSIMEGASRVVKKWAMINRIGINDIPPSLLKRFRSPGGTYVAYVNPKQSIWEISFLSKFVKEIKSVSDDATGFPVTHRFFVIQAGQAIVKAIIFAIVPVIIILLIDFRSIRPTVLSLVPLAIGVIWLQGVLLVSGQPYNVASVAGLPLLLGLGVVYGVHIVHRWLERPGLSAYVATQTTGRGVAFSALTTITGLFSIVFARHGGVSTFGQVLLYGIFLCLITALFVLPFVIDRLVRR